MNHSASDLSGDAFQDTVPRSHQIQLAPSNPSPFFNSFALLPGGTIRRLYWRSAAISRMDSEVYGITIRLNCAARSVARG